MDGWIEMEIQTITDLPFFFKWRVGAVASPATYLMTAVVFSVG
jgi:hypothetical protein